MQQIIIGLIFLNAVVLTMTATMCKPDIADDMIRVIREESDKAIQHLETLKSNYNEQ